MLFTPLSLSPSQLSFKCCHLRQYGLRNEQCRWIIVWCSFVIAIFVARLLQKRVPSTTSIQFVLLQLGLNRKTAAKKKARVKKEKLKNLKTKNTCRFQFGLSFKFNSRNRRNRRSTSDLDCFFFF